MRNLGLLLGLLSGCVGGGDTGGDETGETGDSGGGCAASDTVAVITDIDETLTTDDLEWLYQIADPDHDPEMRPDANTLFQGWSDQGWRVIYLTARGEDSSLLDGTPARDATTGWLDLHGFPYADEDVYLASGFGALGDSAAEYKAEVLAGLAADGVSVLWAYGNADTDIEAYQAAGIADDQIFLVGDLAGEYGVVGIATEDAYTNHAADFLPTLGCAE